MIHKHITGAWHLFFALTLALALPHLTGCAAGCKSAQRAWEQGTKPEGGGGAHWRLEVPRAELDEQLSGAAGQVKGAAWRPRSPLEGLSLPKLKFKLKRLDLEASDRDAARLRVTVGLYAARDELLTLSLVGASPVQLDAAKRKARLVVRADQFKRADLALGDGAERGLKEALARWLPAPLRPLVPAAELKRAAGELLKLVSEEGYGVIREQLLTPLGALVRLEVGLPAVPVSRLDLSLTPALWRVELHTTLKARGLPAPRPLPAGGGARLSVSGSWLAAAASWAMGRGDLPGRFNTNGAPNPAGVATARLTWSRAEEDRRPLKAHLLADPARTKVCLYARVGAAPSFSVAGGKAQVGVEGGVEKVVGHPAAELAAELTGLTERSLAWHASSSLPRSLKTPAGSFSWSWLDARLAGGALEVSLGLSPRPSSKPSSKPSAKKGGA